MNEKIAHKAVESRDIVLAAWADAAGAVRQLLDDGVDPNSPPGDSSLRGPFTALFFAARYGNAQMIRSLVERGAEINTRGLHGNTPLLEAADHNGPAGRLPWAALSGTVKLLIELGADPRLSNQTGRSILHSLAYNQAPECPELIELLIERGADVNSKDENGRTPLNTAAWSGLEGVAETLIRHGADVNASDVDGNTSLMIAARTGAKMVTVNRDGRNILVPDDISGHVRIARILIANGTAIDAKNKAGKTALILAQDKGHQHLVEVLIAKNQQTSAVDDNTSAGLSQPESPGKIHESLLTKPSATGMLKASVKTARDTSCCHYCGNRFQVLRSGLYTGSDVANIGDMILRGQKGCSACGIPVCFDCAASAADKKGMKGHCVCPQCGTNLDRH
jgi:ankyrin repeat protein